MIRRFHRYAKKEKGQVLMIVALLTTVLLGMVAMTVDIGVFVHERQHVQDTVDAAALAGAQQLGVNQTQAQTDALSYAASNDSNMDASVTFRCLVGDRNGDGIADPADIGPVCNPGPNGSFVCVGGRCVSMCVPVEGDSCNTIVVGGSKTVQFSFARAVRIFNANTGIIRAAACKGACGSPPTVPVDAVMILDRTGSMDATELANAKAAANSVLTLYNPNIQHIALGALGPSLTTSTCGSPYSGGLGLASSDQTVGSWVPVPFSTDYRTSASTPTLNSSSLIVKSIACLNTSGVGTNLGNPVKAAATYIAASGRPGVKKAILLFTDGAANAWIVTPTATPPSTPTPVPTNTGYLNCSANAAVTSSAGDNNGYETTASNACADGGGNAVDTNSGTGTSTSCTNTGKDKHRYYNYGISLPGGATLDGIEVRIDANVDSASGTRVICAELSWDGGSTWTSTKQTGNLGTSQATSTLGSSSDDWGHSGWTATQLNNTNFRVRLTDVSDNNLRDFTLDWVAVRVTYTVASPTPTTAPPPAVGLRGPCDFAVQQATLAKAANIEVFSLGYGLSGEICNSSTGELASSAWYNQPVTKVLAAMATDSIDETGCTNSSGVNQENSDNDHFYCEVNSGGLSAIFAQAAAVLAASPHLISLPGG